MKHCKLIAIDLAKTVFQVCVFDENNEVKSNTQFKRKRFIEHLAQYQPTTVVMEACYSANYFGRLFESYGHTVKLIPAQHVKPFVRGNKNKFVGVQFFISSFICLNLLALFSIMNFTFVNVPVLFMINISPWPLFNAKAIMIMPRP